MSKDGYAGKILTVDLSAGRVTTADTLPELKSRYLGGCGFGARLLYEEVPAGADPLGAANALVLATGPVTGTIIPSSAMTVGMSKSPLTGAVIRSVMGGFFGPELKQAGYDALVVKGAASGPVYLLVDNDRVELLPADQLWGMNAFDTQVAIRNRTPDPGLQVAAIGPAGEKMRPLCRHHSRHSGAGARRTWGRARRQETEGHRDPRHKDYRSVGHGGRHSERPPSDG